MTESGVMRYDKAVSMTSQMFATLQAAQCCAVLQALVGTYHALLACAEI